MAYGFYNDRSKAPVYDISEANEYIRQQIAAAHHLKKQIVDTLPTPAQADADTLYYIMNQETGFYDIYQLIDGQMVRLDDTTIDLSDYVQFDDLANVAFSGDYDDLIDKPTLATVATTGDYDDLINKPNLATVATTGDYDDLTNKPTLATVATSGDYDDLVNKPNFATVATSGDYDDLVNKPNLATVATTGDYGDLANTPDLSNYATKQYVDDAIDAALGVILNASY